MVTFMKKSLLVLSVMMLLTSCFGNKTEYIPVRMDKTPENTKGTLKPAKRQKILVYRDDGPNKETKAGTTEIGPEYVLVFEKDFDKVATQAKRYNNVMAEWKKLLDKKVITQDIYNLLLQVE